MRGTWKCPSLCNESLIQNPIAYDDEETVDGVILRTHHCELCGKEMSYHIKCSSRRRCGYIILHHPTQ